MSNSARRKHGRRRKSHALRNFFLFLLLLVVIAAAAVGYGYASGRLRIFFSVDEENVSIPYGEEYTSPDIQAVISVEPLLPYGIPLHVTKSGEVDAHVVGTYTETYTAGVFGLITGEMKRTVLVADLTAPEVTLNGAAEVTMDQQEAGYEDPGCKAVDNVDGDLTDKVAVSGQVDATKGGTYTLEYSVVDSSGNKGTAVRTIIVKDTLAPEITVEGQEVMSVDVGADFQDPGATAVDATDGNVSVTVDGTVDSSTAGVYELTYTATDAAGNKAEKKRTVYVKKDVAVEDPGSKVVYLSFDDGPGKYTQQLLDVLDKYGVKVTFFVTNQFPGYANMIAKEAAAGHTVAIHTYSHEFSEVYSSIDGYFADLNKMSDVIEKQTGVKPDILRFPGGSSNTVSRKYCEGIMTELAAAVEARGYQYVDWNVDSKDAGGASTSEEVAENVIAGLQRNRVSFVLQHDIKEFSVNAVETIIQWGLENGYTFRPLTQSSPHSHHDINN